MPTKTPFFGRFRFFPRYCNAVSSEKDTSKNKKHPQTRKFSTRVGQRKASNKSIKNLTHRIKTRTKRKRTRNRNPLKIPLFHQKYTLLFTGDNHLITNNRRFIILDTTHARSRSHCILLIYNFHFLPRFRHQTSTDHLV